MSKSRFVLNQKGVRELLRSDAMKKIVENKAKSAHSRLGPGYETTTFVGKNRVNASVYAKTVEARIENSQNNSLLKAVHK